MIEKLELSDSLGSGPEALSWLEEKGLIPSGGQLQTLEQFLELFQASFPQGKVVHFARPGGETFQRTLLINRFLEDRTNYPSRVPTFSG